jgi:hypothetical protein
VRGDGQKTALLAWDPADLHPVAGPSDPGELAAVRPGPLTGTGGDGGVPGVVSVVVPTESARAGPAGLSAHGAAAPATAARRMKERRSLGTRADFPLARWFR